MFLIAVLAACGGSEVHSGSVRPEAPEIPPGDWPDDVLRAFDADCAGLSESEVTIGGAVTAGQTKVELALINEPCPAD